VVTLIDGIGLRGPILPRTGRTRSADEGWADMGLSVGQAPPQAVGTQATAGLDGLLALQESAGEAVDAAERDRHARTRGREVLAALASLQAAILGGGDPTAILQRLRTMTDGLPAAADPVLAAALSAIRLRARVELARRGL
jgi:hypothetical protein